jgi:hypothetical protein
MRCLSCNARLSEFEATRRGVNTNDFIDLCDSCFRHIADDVHVLEREDLEEEGFESLSSDHTDLDFSVDNPDNE